MTQIEHGGLILFVTLFSLRMKMLYSTFLYATVVELIFLAWTHEKTGDYSVRSAYHALVNQNEHLALDEGTVTGTSKTEKQMWSTL